MSVSYALRASSSSSGRPSGSMPCREAQQRTVNLGNPCEPPHPSASSGCAHGTAPWPAQRPRQRLSHSQATGPLWLRLPAAVAGVIPPHPALSCTLPCYSAIHALQHGFPSYRPVWTGAWCTWRAGAASLSRTGCTDASLRTTRIGMAAPPVLRHAFSTQHPGLHPCTHLLQHSMKLLRAEVGRTMAGRVRHPHRPWAQCHKFLYQLHCQRPKTSLLACSCVARSR